NVLILEWAFHRTNGLGCGAGGSIREARIGAVRGSFKVSLGRGDDLCALRLEPALGLLATVRGDEDELDRDLGYVVQDVRCQQTRNHTPVMKANGKFQPAILLLV